MDPSQQSLVTPQSVDPSAPKPVPARRFSGRWHHTAVLALTSLAVSFLCLELGARAFYPAPPDPGRLPPILYQYDPDLDYAHVPDQQGWIDDGWVTINKMGFRGPLPAVPKPPNVFRIVAVGDSVTLGWGVNDDQTFPALLERLLNGSSERRVAEVINCGVSGYDASQESRLIAKFAPILQPDLLLIGFYWNDLPRNALTKSASSQEALPTLTSESVRSGKKFRLGVEPSAVNRLLRRSRALYATKNLVLLSKNALGPGNVHVSLERSLLDGRGSSEIDAAWGAVESSFSRVGAAAAAGGYSVALVILPSREQLSRDYPHARYQTRAAAIAGHVGFDVIDPLPEFEEQRSTLDTLFIAYDRDHPAPAGHQLIARSIFQTLVQKRPDLLRRVSGRP